MSCSEVGTHSEILLASLANDTRLTVKTFLQEARDQNNQTTYQNKNVTSQAVRLALNMKVHITSQRNINMPIWS